MSSTSNWLTRIIGSILFMTLNLLVTPIVVGFGVLISIVVIGVAIVTTIFIFSVQEIAGIVGYWNSGNS